jgi:UDP-N-acetylglucosamine:LPS N-acetylglucosamine transferase
MVNHFCAEEMKAAIISSEVIIARSGYSTVMDLSSLEKKAIFIPTPGQTEQEYLAEYFKDKKVVYYQKQSEFDLVKALKESENYSGFKSLPESKELLKRIDLILS